ncbi:MAG: aminodeoxychorismate/anthranilate synthase component II [Planctomycetota bacterium]|nr:aminodeoxychorismate/anthranilate synthase component II [Planctomycetota bacterium]MDI6788501.1 aminodeoxychorismate/anthranilate synthase component II [Planctomycetota bacterium]
MILLIDNYDSFTYNLVQAFGEILLEKKGDKNHPKEIKIFRNNKITLSKARQMKPSHLVISPGPKRPEDAGISNALLKYFCGKIPILGVCLGHQCLAHIFGGKVIRAKYPVHGKTSKVYHDNKTIYQQLGNPFIAARYHSLIVDERTLPKCFEVSAYTADGEIMGIRMKDELVEGVQFHPESYLTAEGKQLLKNFLEI